MKRAVAVLALMFLVSAIVPTVAGAAPPTCGGKPATIVGTSGDDTLTGTPHDDVIVGRAGNDMLNGRGGNDTICGNRGRDFLRGESDHDVLLGGRAPDTLDAGSGNDRIVGGRGSDYMINGPGDDVFRGGGGPSDLVDFYAARSGVVVDLAAGTATGDGSDTLAGIEAIFATRFDDILRGDARPNTFAARDGNDTIETGGGGILSGIDKHGVFDEADRVYPEGGDDSVTGGEGLDVVGYFDAPSPLTIDLAQGTAVGEGSDTLVGVEGVHTSRNGDTVIGDDGDNYFALAGGDHTVDGQGGRDLVYLTYALGERGQPLATAIDISAGTITAQGDSTIESIEDIWGTDGPDTITGDDGANLLKGRGGDDVIAGGSANDELVGGAGTDEGDGGTGEDVCRTIEVKTNCES